MIKKALFLIAAAVLFISCKGNFRDISYQTVSSGVFSSDRSLEIEAVGVGMQREVAILFARAFLAEQLKGIDFTYTKNSFTTSVKNVELKGSVVTYIGRLKDGQFIAAVKIGSKISSASGGVKYRQIIIKVRLSSIIDERDDIYKSVVERIVKKEGQTSLKGKIFISFPYGIRLANSTNDYVKVKIIVVY